MFNRVNEKANFEFQHFSFALGIVPGFFISLIVTGIFCEEESSLVFECKAIGMLYKPVDLIAPVILYGDRKSVV